MAALVACLPSDCAVNRARSGDAKWTLEAQLLAYLVNQINDLLYGMSDPKRRGKRPDLIGPEFMRNARSRTLDAQVMTIDQLMAELSKPRR